jgi:hypothetical protein
LGNISGDFFENTWVKQMASSQYCKLENLREASGRDQREKKQNSTCTSPFPEKKKNWCDALMIQN